MLVTQAEKARLLGDLDTVSEVLAKAGSIEGEAIVERLKVQVGVASVSASDEVVRADTSALAG